MPKGDADNLRADLDDGYAKVANLLLEGLCCAPLSAAEYAVSLFIMRRTYGWAQHYKRDTGKVDCMTAEQIAEGTALSRSGVHKALQGLYRANIILREPAKAGNYFSYGMNPDIAQWGLPTPDWKTCKQQLRDSRDNHTYNRNGLEVCPKRVRPLTQTGHRSNPNGAEGQALSPTASGAPAPPTDSITDKNKHISPTERKKLRQSELEAQRLSLMERIPQDDHALVLVYLENAAQETKSKQITVGGEVSRLESIVQVRDELVGADETNGPDAWRYGMMQANQHGASHPNYVRKAAASWTPGTLDGKPGGQAQKGLFYVDSQGRSVYENRWDAHTATVIRALDAEGKWDRARGMTYDDERHPDFAKGGAA